MSQQIFSKFSLVLLEYYREITLYTDTSTLENVNEFYLIVIS